MQHGTQVARSAVLVLQNKLLVDLNVFACVSLRLYSTVSRSLPSELNLPFPCQALLSVGQVLVFDLEWAALVKNPTPVWL